MNWVEKIAMTLDEAFQIFGVLPNISKEQLRKRYIELVKKNHFDRSGQHEGMTRINVAYELLKNRTEISNSINEEPIFTGTNIDMYA